MLYQHSSDKKSHLKHTQGFGTRKVGSDPEIYEKYTFCLFVREWGRSEDWEDIVLICQSIKRHNRSYIIALKKEQSVHIKIWKLELSRQTSAIQCKLVTVKNGLSQ